MVTLEGVSREAARGPHAKRAKGLTPSRNDFKNPRSDESWRHRDRMQRSHPTPPRVSRQAATPPRTQDPMKSWRQRDQCSDLTPRRQEVSRQAATPPRTQDPMESRRHRDECSDLTPHRQESHAKPRRRQERRIQWSPGGIPGWRGDSSSRRCVSASRTRDPKSLGGIAAWRETHLRSLV